MATGKKIRTEESIQKQNKSFIENKEKKMQEQEQLVKQIREEKTRKFLDQKEFFPYHFFLQLM